MSKYWAAQSLSFTGNWDSDMHDLCFFSTQCLGMEEILESCTISGQGHDGFSAAVSLNSLFPLDRKMGYINNLVCQKRVHEAKCNNVCNVIRDLWMKSAIDNQTVSTDTYLSQPEHDGKQVVVRRADPTGRVPLSTKVCILKSPCPAWVRQKTVKYNLLKSNPYIFLMYLFFVMKIQGSVTSCCLLHAFPISYLRSVPKCDFQLNETVKNNSLLQT